MNAQHTSIIHLLSVRNEALHEELLPVVDELVIEQNSGLRRASLWCISSSVLQQAPTHQRYFQEQAKKFTIDPKLESAILQQAGDVIFHLHGGMNPALYVVANLLFRHSISFVFSPHNAYESLVARRSGYLNAWYFRFYERKLLQRASAIHCATEPEAEGLQTLFPNEKTMQVPYGYKSLSGKTALPGRDKLVLGFSCDADHSRKGIETLIHAFSFVKQVNERAELWLFGDCAQESLLRRKIQSRGLTADVVFVNAGSAEERADRLSRVNIMIDTACGEGIPVAVIEAASMGVPCVAAECSVIGEAIRTFDCGEVVTNLDETELFNAIMTLHYRLGLDGAVSFGARAKEMVGVEFNWKQILPKLDLLYNVA